MTKGRAALPFGMGCWETNRRSLGFARDDKAEGGASIESGCKNCHPDRSEAKRRDLRFSRRFLGMFLCRLSGQCTAQDKLQRLLLLFVLRVGKTALKVVGF